MRSASEGWNSRARNGKHCLTPTACRFHRPKYRMTKAHDVSPSTVTLSPANPCLIHRINDYTGATVTPEQQLHRRMHLRVRTGTSHGHHRLDSRVAPFGCRSAARALKTRTAATLSHTAAPALPHHSSLPNHACHMHRVCPCVRQSMCCRGRKMPQMTSSVGESLHVPNACMPPTHGAIATRPAAKRGGKPARPVQRPAVGHNQAATDHRPAA